MFMFLAVPASTSVDLVADTPNRMAYTTGTSYAVSLSGVAAREPALRTHDAQARRR